jgi:hypothetical protein
MFGRGRILATLFIPATLGAALYACDHPVSLLPVECDPTVGPDDLLWCEPKHDAGAPDAPNVMAPLPCDCVRHFSEDWMGPGLFWVGPVSSPDELPKCPKVAPTFERDGWMDLDSPPAICDACACATPLGECTTLPSEITVRAAPCDTMGETLPYDGPAGWDGSCTDADAIPAGAKCPSGSQTLCAQSIYVSELGAPIEQACAPLAPLPPELPPATWQTYALMCSASNSGEPDCPTNNQVCAPPVAAAPVGWRQCIRRDGNHECPEGWDGPKFTMYSETAIDEGRSCSECQCGSPLDGACAGLFTAYEDASCQVTAAQYYPIKSTEPVCINLMPTGIALGSKSITDLKYVPGTCPPTGGEPQGEAVPNSDGATTICCQRDPEPPP